MCQVVEHEIQTPLFPALTELVCHLGPTTQPTLTIAQLLLPPSLRKVSIYLQEYKSSHPLEQMLSTLLSAIQLRRIPLEVLRVQHESDGHSFTAMLAKRCTELPNLRYIDCAFECSSPDVRWAADLMRHPSLTFVRLWLGTVQVCLSSTLPGLGGPVHMRLSCPDLETIPSALPSLPPLSLVSLSVHTERPAHDCGAHWAALAQAIAVSFGTSLHTVRLAVRFPPLERAHGAIPRLAHQCTQPWLAFPEVRDFACVVHAGLLDTVHPRMDDVAAIARAWPLLEHLKMGLGNEDVLPLYTLLELARGCTLLKTVDLLLEKDPTLDAWYQNDGLNHGLEAIYYQRHLEQRNELLVVDALHEVFPAAEIARLPLHERD